MSNVRYLPDDDLQTLATSTEKQVSAVALGELRRRDRRHQFLRGTLVAWLALAVAMVSLARGCNNTAKTHVQNTKEVSHNNSNTR